MTIRDMMSAGVEFGNNTFVRAFYLDGQNYTMQLKNIPEYHMAKDMTVRRIYNRFEDACVDIDVYEEG